MTLSDSIINYLKAAKLPHHNNTITAGGYAGVEDITVLVNGSYVAIEVKQLGEAQTAHQKVREVNITNNGGFYYLIYDLDSLKRIINKYKKGE